MMEFIAENGGYLAFIVMVVMMVNFILTGIKKALELVMDKTKTPVDNSIYKVIHAIVSFFDKVIEFLTANTTKK